EALCAYTGAGSAVGRMKSCTRHMRYSNIHWRRCCRKLRAAHAQSVVNGAVPAKSRLTTKTDAMRQIFKSGDIKTFERQVTKADCAMFDSGPVHPVYATFALARDAEWCCRL